MGALAFVGLVAYPFLPVAPLPQVDFPTIQVTATWQGASGETMASSVAAPLERQSAQIPRRPWCSDSRCMKREHGIGASVSETSADTEIEAVTVSANSRNMRPMMPPMSKSGMNTASISIYDIDAGHRLMTLEKTL